MTVSEKKKTPITFNNSYLTENLKHDLPTHYFPQKICCNNPSEQSCKFTIIDHVRSPPSTGCSTMYFPTQINRKKPLFF